MSDKNLVLFDRVKTNRTFEDVFTKIKEQIINGNLKPGYKLPSEAQLASQLGVGRQTIREALRLLEASGFIKINRGVKGGPVVENSIIDSISSLSLDAYKIKAISLEEITLARLEIEKLVLNYAIDNVTEADIKKLQDNIIKARKKILNNKVATEDNVQFHILLANASKNQIFSIIVKTIMPLVLDLLNQLKPDIKTSAEVIKCHEEILNAILEKKRGKAILSLERHLINVRTRLQPFLKQKNKDTNYNKYS